MVRQTLKIMQQMLKNFKVFLTILRHYKVKGNVTVNMTSIYWEKAPEKIELFP